ncbi:unnamed protein product [Urochloa humidicola]
MDQHANRALELLLLCQIPASGVEAEGGPEADMGRIGGLVDEHLPASTVAVVRRPPFYCMVSAGAQVD